MLLLVDHKDVIRDLKFSPDGSLLLLSASRDNTLKVWDLKDDGNMAITLRGHSNWVYGCAFAPDANMVASVGAKKTVSTVTCLGISHSSHINSRGALCFCCGVLFKVPIQIYTLLVKLPFTMREIAVSFHRRTSRPAVTQSLVDKSSDHGNSALMTRVGG